MNKISIKVSGLIKEDSIKVVTYVKQLINEFGFLDIRRLSKVLITSDYKKDIHLVTKNFRHKLQSNEVAKALVLLVPKDESFENILLLDSAFILNLLKNKKSIEYKKAFHVLYHEFAHIHDNNQKIDNLKDFMKSKKYIGVSSITYPLAEICWSEYIANFISANSVLETNYTYERAKTLVFILNRLETLKKKIHFYKEKKKKNEYIYFIKSEIEMFFKAMAYLIGYLNALGITLEELNEEFALEIDKSIFSQYYFRLIYELNSIHLVYPYGFLNTNIYNNTSQLIKEFYKEFQIEL